MEGIKPCSSKAEEITKHKNAIFVFWNKKLNLKNQTICNQHTLL